ncbi:MAG: co-chaperone GroES [Patescibacteria group bacterium]
MKKKTKKGVNAKKQKKVAVKSSRSTAPIVPLNDRVLVRPLSADDMATTTASGIIIPDSAKEKPEQGTVIAVGPGKWEDGKRTPVGVSVGHKVVVREYSKNVIKIKGEEYWIISESDVLAIIN